ncbi:cobalt/nickel transport system permease protein [Acetoanaerobium pronyense]|uniref:Cobalt/nickel transport system permease protein n=2 Tax=Acetoanaerobium pronyense TaxID=1482736 RepID=A0ABS4KJD9_9FIRM|nr:cobalt/nickel transport system permease protein [Acetoanaerobium pronyense]
MDMNYKIWEPRIKLISLFIGMIILSGMRDIFYLGFGFFLIFIFALIHEVDYRTYMRRIFHMMPFFIFLLLPLSLRGGQGFEIEGLMFGLGIVIKACTGILAIMIIVSGQEEAIFWSSLRKLKVPAKLITIIFLTTRYLVLFKEKLNNFRKAVYSRQFQSGFTYKTFKTYGELSGAFIVKGFDQSEKLYKALWSRGFNGEMPIFKTSEIKILDLVKGFFIVGVCLILWFADKW